ncbi:arsenate reductase (glutaredoxin) [Flavobacterium cyanobacteriorum]|uniref:Arsenate reductase (Glutaredoxin) n=1 Tax=Flavobacterium cyanobacteriorum TaxID=2022802 RepID=A0A255ZA92_9FLAO|nr:arsenate reductase (glutaredoxin) [Flavobacterium cyanobacteriorum]OYQ38376.1 arsenate reductase (glutaredoxin) [Flavobacterium cyanobacteriorum]
MITIYHNPRCSKSREGLHLLELEGRPFTVVKYIDEGITKEELTRIITMLGIKPIELVRQKEKVWIDNFKNRQLTDNNVIDAMVSHPNLIERPVVVNGNKAVIARPAQRIKQIL